MAALRAAAEQRRDAMTAAGTDAPPPAIGREHVAPVAGRWARRLLAAAAVVIAFVCGAVLTVDPPGPVRDVAHGIGLDVDSRDMVAARERLQDLGAALAVATGSKVEQRLTDAELDAVARTDRDMLQAVARLDPDERTAFVPTAHQVHLRAVALFLAEGRDLATAQPRDLDELGAGS